MESRVKTLGAAFSVCAVLVAGPGLAQDNAPAADPPQAASDRDAPRREGADNGGADAKGSPAGNRAGDRGANQGRPRESGAVRVNAPSRAGPGTDAGRNGATAPAGGLGMTPGNQGAAPDQGGNPIRLEAGWTGLQRRANRKMLIANAPKMPAGALTNPGLGPPSMRSGADAGVVRNAVGMVVPSGGRGAGHAIAGYAAHGGIGANGFVPGGATGTSAIGAGTAAGHGGGADLHRAAIPLNAVTGPAVHAAGINGTTMGHIASGPGYIGGPAKDRSGINGTALRPKH